jgi:small subunit ribosomal protein S5e
LLRRESVSSLKISNNCLIEEKKSINRLFYNEEIKLFGQYEYNVEVEDLSITDLIAINTPKSNVYIPHTAGRYQQKRFRKTTCPIIERITNSLMRHGRNNGKKNLAIAIVKQALDIIALITNKNPLETILRAISNAGPREDSTRIGSGGAVKKTAVDVSPLRRVNMGIYLITTGARESSFRNIRNIAECLADEFIACASLSNSSYALRKKEEIERSAKSNR